MNNFNASYEKILTYLKTLTEKENFLDQIRKPKLSDIQLIAMCITSEYLSIDSECQLFRVLPNELAVRMSGRFLTNESANYSPILPNYRIMLHRYLPIVRIIT